MKHLKSFLENNNELENTIHTIEEICYELEDTGKFTVDVYTSYVGIHVPSPSNAVESWYMPFSFEEVKDVCLRLKSFLGDRFVEFTYEYAYDGETNMIDLEEDTIIEDKITWVNIWYDLNI